MGKRTFIICILLTILIAYSRVLYPAASVGENSAGGKEELLIVLDPGHGGAQSGAVSKDGATMEKDLNLTIALKLKEKLETYEGVRVLMTREDDRDVDLDRRSEIAEEVQADLLVSLHNNAFGGNSTYKEGAFVLAAKGQYRKKLAEEEQKLACNVLYELTQIGLTDQGILLRESEDGETYPNGKKADYYRIIKAGIKNRRMQILIEHAYIDSDEDFEKFLSSDEKLEALAQADARGIARYYGLRSKKTGNKLPELKNYLEKRVLFRKHMEPKEGLNLYYPQLDISPVLGNEAEAEKKP